MSLVRLEEFVVVRRTELARLRRDLSELRDWRPLSTAPKGQDIRMLMRNGKVIVCALKPGFGVEDASVVFEGWLPLEVPRA